MTDASNLSPCLPLVQLQQRYVQAGQRSPRGKTSTRQPPARPAGGEGETQFLFVLLPTMTAVVATIVRKKEQNFLSGALLMHSSYKELAFSSVLN